MRSVKMECLQSAVLLAMLLIITVDGQARQQGWQRIFKRGCNVSCPSARSNIRGCDSETCGINAKCTIRGGRPVCSCPHLHIGDPSVECIRVECQIDEDCPDNRACLNNKCIDRCPDLCGLNAQCKTRNHVSTCYCPPAYTGDPYTSCRIADPQAACKPSPCGPNMKCEVINKAIICSCLPGYQRSGAFGCMHECERDSDCQNHLACSSDFKCESPCKCGENANCEVINHRAICSCPHNWLGSPYVSCRPECTYHSDCPRSKPACLAQRCSNPCEGACGINANCKLRDITPICSCPRNMTGYPSVRCEPIDLCSPNPCGINALCTPGEERAVCTCPTGYIGQPLISCQRGECLSDDECPDHKACVDCYCVNPCTENPCAPHAICSSKRHNPVCTCPEGTRGDGAVNCHPIHARSYGLYNYRYVLGLGGNSNCHEGCQ